MESKSSRPFYLQSEKSNLRTKITIGVILLVLALTTPPLFIILIAYAVYIVLQIKKNKSEEVNKFEEILQLYFNKDYRQCLDRCEEYNYKDNLKIHIIKALCLYESEDYQGYIHLISNLSDKRIDEDIDVVLKLAQSYEYTEQSDKAKEAYGRLLKYHPNSKFLKDKIG
jgi:tetratricopeptide (TPR) repeat protein